MDSFMSINYLLIKFTTYTVNKISLSFNDLLIALHIKLTFTLLLLFKPVIEM